MLRQVTSAPFWSVFLLFPDPSPTPSSHVTAHKATVKILAERRVPPSTHPSPSLFLSHHLLGPGERAFARKLRGSKMIFFFFFFAKLYVKLFVSQDLIPDQGLNPGHSNKSAES